MATVKIPEPTLQDNGVSHWISRNNHDPYDTEEIVFRYSTEWRGDPVVVDMTARRGRHGWNREDLTWSAWQVYCSRARVVTSGDLSGYSYESSPVSDLARSRLGEACQPAVKIWLASDAYDESRQDAIYRFVRREVLDMRNDHYATRRVRDLLYAVNLEMPGHRAMELLNALNRFDEFLDALGE